MGRATHEPPIAWGRPTYACSVSATGSVVMAVPPPTIPAAAVRCAKRTAASRRESGPGEAPVGSQLGRAGQLGNSPRPAWMTSPSPAFRTRLERLGAEVELEVDRDPEVVR
jgi:hypothetical protein